jgi:CRP/FNR family cyclic AMP-dependent transcriptional regulator
MSSVAGLTEAVTLIRDLTLFRLVAGDGPALEKIAALCKTNTLPKGSTVIDEGLDGQELYIIRSGIVEVLKRTMHGDSYTVSELSAGAQGFFGEVALLDSEKRSATVICKTDCDFYIIDRLSFNRFGDENPRLGLLVTREISHILCQRLRKANADIISLFDALVSEVEESGGIANS